MYSLIIFHFNVNLGYKVFFNFLTLVNNIILIFEKQTIIKKKFNKDLILGYITQIQKFNFLYIYLSLNLIFKYYNS